MDPSLLPTSIWLQVSMTRRFNVLSLDALSDKCRKAQTICRKLLSDTH